MHHQAADMFDSMPTSGAVRQIIVKGGAEKKRKKRLTSPRGSESNKAKRCRPEEHKTHHVIQQLVVTR